MGERDAEIQKLRAELLAMTIKTEEALGRVEEKEKAIRIAMKEEEEVLGRVKEMEEALERLRMEKKSLQIYHSGFPSFGNGYDVWNQSDASTEKYVAATIIPKRLTLSNIAFSDNINGVLIPSMKHTICSHEDSVGFVMSLVVSEIISAANMSISAYKENLAMQSSAVADSSNEKKTQIAPDVSFLREKGGRPFVVLEFKVGKNEDADVLSGTTSPVIGEAYERMHALREVFGVRDVFSILTTYEQLRVLWLEDADWLAQQSISIEDITTKQKQFVSDNIANLGPSSFDYSKRQVYGTDVYSRRVHGQGENCEMMRVIASVILKGLAGSRLQKWREVGDLTKLPPDFIITAKPKEGSLTWEVPNSDYRSKPLQVYTGAAPLNAASVGQSSILLLRHLGAGHDGSAWLAAVTSDGNPTLLVAKRFASETTADRELSVWMRVYPNMAYKRVLERAGAHFLLMPYFTPVVEAERKDSLPELKKLLQTAFWGKNIAHMDVGWSNIGRLGGKLYLFDLALCEGNITCL